MTDILKLLEDIGRSIMGDSTGDNTNEEVGQTIVAHIQAERDRIKQHPAPSVADAMALVEKMRTVGKRPAPITTEAVKDVGRPMNKYDNLDLHFIDDDIDSMVTIFDANGVQVAKFTGQMVFLSFVKGLRLANEQGAKHSLLNQKSNIWIIKP